MVKLLVIFLANLYRCRQTVAPLLLVRLAMMAPVAMLVMFGSSS
ncbi:hypothetical protein KR49_00040 [Synechococcus sp. KORDI-49]|nr:hypothetical protein KR49_00040 [Synechococcus sp. KORDI-49]